MLPTDLQGIADCAVEFERLRYTRVGLDPKTVARESVEIAKEMAPYVYIETAL